MFKNYLLTALRNLWKSRFFTFINLLGLATGIASFLFITIYLKDELSYDRFNKKSDRIYRIATHGNLGNTVIHQTGTSARLGWTIKSEYPEVEQSLRMINIGKSILKANIKEFTDFSAVFCDSTLLDIFTFEFTAGDPKHVFDDSHAAMISESAARKIYGADNPINKTIAIKGWLEFRITGIYKDIPTNSHFHADLILNFASWDISKNTNWWSNNFHTYLLLKNAAMQKSLETKLPDFIKRHLFNSPDYYTKFVSDGNDWTFKLQPLTSIHLTSHLNGEHEANGNIAYIYIFSIAAIFILIIACINFMNLTIAKSITRFREVGVRKVLGGTKRQLIFQFLGESLLLSIFAGFFALIIVELLLPAFSQFTRKAVEISLHNPQLILVLVGVTFSAGIIAGLFPALLLSSFRPSRILKGEVIRNTNSVSLRSILVILQFAISVFLIIGTLVVNSQLHFMINKDLGFDKENILLIKRLSQYNDDQLKTFKQEIAKNPAIISASYSANIPMTGLPNWGVTPENQQQQMITLNCIVGDPDFLTAYRLEIVKGRFFSRDLASDSTGIVINEKTLKLLGWKDPLDKKMFFGREVPYHVIGVVRDFHYESLHQEIRPGAVLMKVPWGSPETDILSVRILGKNLPLLIAQMQKEWGKISSLPMEYSFFKQDYQAMYQNEQKTGDIMLIFAILGIFIACLGLFGLSYFVGEQRTKEIGIRKVMGASSIRMTYMLLSRFLIWIVLAGTLAIPLSYMALNFWLRGFAYRINFPLWVFLFAIGIVFAIAFITVIFQTLRKAAENPIKSLRYE
jgi:putative ABC transport system permease protein